MLHGLNLGLVAVWIQDERRKRSYQLDRAEELALMMAEGSLDVTPEERTAIILLAELDRLGEWRLKSWDQILDIKSVAVDVQICR